MIERAGSVAESVDQTEFLRGRGLALLCQADSSLCFVIGCPFVGDSGGPVDGLSGHAATLMLNLRWSPSRLPLARETYPPALHLAFPCGWGAAAEGLVLREAKLVRSSISACAISVAVSTNSTCIVTISL